MDESGLLRELFDMVDEDKSGSIDKMELRTFLLTLPKMSDSKVGEIMKTADEDQSGEVEFDEFVTVLSLACRDLPTDEVIGTFREVRDKKALEMKERLERFNKAGGGEPPPTLKRRKSVSIKEPEPPAAPQSNEELEEMKKMLAKATETISTISSEMKSLQENSASQAASQEDQINNLKKELEREKERVAEEAKKKEEALKKQLEEAWEKGQQPAKTKEVNELEERLKKAERALKEQESELKAAKQARREVTKSRLDNNTSQFRRLRPELKIIGGGSNQRPQEENGEKSPGLYLAPGSVQAANAGAHNTGITPDGPAYNPLSRRAPARGKPPVLGRTVQRGTMQQMLAFCMGCGAGHRGNLTPHSTPPSKRVGAGGMGNMSTKTEYYCRACKRKTRRELRDSAPNPSELAFPVDESQNLWYCLNCGTREFSGRAAGAREKGYCDRCSQFSSFICQVSTLNPPVAARFANDRMLFCQGCGMEEWALEGDREFGEHQLYCYNCCGTTAWRCQCWAKSTRTRLPCPNGPLPLWELALRAD